MVGDSRDLCSALGFFKEVPAGLGVADIAALPALATFILRAHFSICPFSTALDA